MKKSTKNTILSLALVSLFTVSNVNADVFSDAVINKEDCPVNAAYPTNKSVLDTDRTVGSYPTEDAIDAEFGLGAQEITQCLKNRINAKVVVRVDHTFMMTPWGTPRLDKPLFFANIDKMINQYENTHGMKIGKDIDIRVVLSGSGAILAAKGHKVFAGAAKKWNAQQQAILDADTTGEFEYTPMTVSPVNPYAAAIQKGIDAGMKFYLCQEASRSIGITMANKIEGINFVPAAHAATADFQMDGYAIILP